MSQNKIKNAPAAAVEPTPVGGCRHYWVIESPRGESSRGICKYCGIEKEFYNSSRVQMPFTFRK